MKYNLILLLAFLILVGLGFVVSNADNDNGATERVNRVVSQYKKDTGFNGSCKVDGHQASLEGIVLGKIAMDSGYGTKGLGAKYNNRGNVKKAQQRKLPKQNKGYTINKDGGNYYVYPTVEEGLYDVAEWAKRRGGDTCTITYASTFCYVKGCKNGVKDDEYVWNYFRGLVSVSQAYDSGVGLSIVDNEETRKQSRDISGEADLEPKSFSEFKLAKEAEARRDAHNAKAELELKKAKREDDEAQKMRARCIQKGVECKDF